MLVALRGQVPLPVVSRWWALPPLGTKMMTSPQAAVLHICPGSFCPPAIDDFVSFGAREEEDSISISASEKDWGELEPDHTEAESPTDLHDEFTRVLAKAVRELDLNWDAPEEPPRSKLNSWYFQSGRRMAASRKRILFFPDVHEHVVKSWSAPQSARIHAPVQSLFSHVDGAEAPVKETFATYLCPSSATLRMTPVSRINHAG